MGWHINSQNGMMLNNVKNKKKPSKFLSERPKLKFEQNMVPTKKLLPNPLLLQQ
jgi:hypothetical protein